MSFSLFSSGCHLYAECVLLGVTVVWFVFLVSVLHSLCPWCHCHRACILDDIVMQYVSLVSVLHNLFLSKRRLCVA